MRTALVLSLIGMILFSACKKDKDDDVISLQGKWNVENYVIREFVNGVLADTETEPGDGETFDFQSNGNLVITTPGVGSESYPYTIRSDSKVEIAGEVYEIRNLTASTVTLYIREDYGGNTYDELIINLKR